MSAPAVSVSVHSRAADAADIPFRPWVHGAAGARQLPVLDSGQLVGIITEADVLRSFGGTPVAAPVPENGALSVAAVMSTRVITVGAEDDVKRAVDLMLNHRVRSLPVFTDGQLVGIITRRDVMRASVLAGAEFDRVFRDDGERTRWIAGVQGGVLDTKDFDGQ